MWFKIDFNILSVENLPAFIRKPEQIAFIKSFVKPIVFIYKKWYKSRLEYFYKLEHNGQVCFLEKALNDKFDPVERRIYIGNGRFLDRIYLFTHNEHKPVYSDFNYLYPRTDYKDTGVSFVVNVPKKIFDTQFYEVNALVDFYKDGAKTHKIEKNE